jgi:hypothetical protein
VTPKPDSQQYWSLDVPGLTRGQAVEVRSFLKDSGISDFATAVDPGEFLTLHLDRDTVRSLLRAVDQQRSSVAGSPDEAAALDGLLEALTDWLHDATGGDGFA